MKKVCVIGGGASGLMAAYAAAENGNEVFLVEKNEKLGKKIYITGKGRCNLTNAVLPTDFIPNVVRGGKFLTGAIYSFPPEKTVGFFEEYGMPTKTERGNRVFPVSDHASDVTKTLEKACKSLGVSFLLQETVTELKTTSSDIGIMPRIVGVKTDKGEYDCDAVIVATGGKSYPSTGSTGDGYTFARRLGLSVTDLKPALCGLELKGDFYQALQGLSLKNVSLTATVGEKRIYSDFGEMLFTHFGISGPIVLSLSSLINRTDLNAVRLALDLKPALDMDTLDKRILRDFGQYQNKQIVNALVDLLPQKLILPVLSTAGISATKPVNVITKEERRRLLEAIKTFPMHVKALRGFTEAIVTSGGVDLSQINPKTMQVKSIEGLYFCGEVLDVDAFTGGFNLQIAFATGFAAGKSIK